MEEHEIPRIFFPGGELPQLPHGATLHLIRKRVDTDHLECPFTWSCGVMSMDKCARHKEMMQLHATGWACLLQKLELAYSVFSNGHRSSGRALLVECVSQLMPPLLACDVIKKYREAIHLVLDCTWVNMELQSMMKEGGTGHSADLHSLRTRIDAMKPIQLLSAPQRAAVLAIKGQMTGDETYLEDSVRLDPDEATWHSMLGLLLYKTCDKGATECKIVRALQHVRTAHRLRPNADTASLLPRLLIEVDGAEQEARKLMAEALERYPSTPQVLERAATVALYTVGERAAACEEARQMLRRCMAVTGETAFLHMAMHTFYLMEDNHHSAFHHWRRAQEVNVSSFRGCEEVMAKVVRM